MHCYGIEPVPVRGLDQRCHVRMAAREDIHRLFELGEL